MMANMDFEKFEEKKKKGAKIYEGKKISSRKHFEQIARNEEQPFKKSKKSQKSKKGNKGNLRAQLYDWAE